MEVTESMNGMSDDLDSLFLLTALHFAATIYRLRLCDATKTSSTDQIWKYNRLPGWAVS